MNPMNTDTWIRYTTYGLRAKAGAVERDGYVSAARHMLDAVDLIEELRAEVEMLRREARQ